MAIGASLVVLALGTLADAPGEAGSRAPAPATLDPFLFSTFVGGSGVDWAHAVVTGENGSIYVAGYTSSYDLPTTEGAYQRANRGEEDVFVLKMASNGSVVEWCTLFGGSGQDIPWALALGADGQVYVTGQTSSDDLPTTQGAVSRVLGGDQDAFVACLFENGSRLHYATYLGGEGVDKGTAVLPLPGGSVFVAGHTESLFFPTTGNAFDRSLGGFSDAFVSRVSWNGQVLEASTYLGGSYTEYEPRMARGDDGRLWLAGSTTSLDFPTSPGAFQREARLGVDAFVTAVKADLSGLGVSTLVGEDGNDVPRSIDLDAQGQVMVAGFTTSTTFPAPVGGPQLESGGGTDGFVMVMDGALDELAASALVGGDDFDAVRTAVFDGRGNVHATGYTNSTDFPVTPDAFKPYKVGDDHDGFYILAAASDLSPSYSTYVGADMGDFGMDLALGPWGVPVLVGHSRSDYFPTTLGAFDASYNGAGDAVVLRLTLDREPPEFGEDLSGGQVPPDMMFWVGINVTDATGVSSVQVEYWFDDRVHHMEEMGTIGGLTYAQVIVVPDDTDYVHYLFLAWDVLGQMNSTSGGMAVAPDWSPPHLVEDMTGGEATTGDPFEFLVMLGDNRAVTGASVEYAVGEALQGNDSLSLVSLPSQTWNRTITVPGDSLDPVTYRFHWHDAAGNTNVTPWREVSVRDDDPPELGELDLPQLAQPGGGLRLNVSASDNIGIASARVEYYESLVLKVVDLPPPYGPFIEAAVPVPTGKGDLVFNLYAVDAAGNEASVGGVVPYADVQPPEVFNVSYPQAATTGDALVVSWQANDSSGIRSTWLKYVFGDGHGPEDYELLPAGTSFPTSVLIPVSPNETGPLHIMVGAVDPYNNERTWGPVTLQVMDDDEPVARAGEDVTVVLPTVVTLSAEGSSDNIAITRYVWTWEPPGGGEPTSVESQDLVVEHGLVPGTYKFHLTVYDAAGNAGHDVVYVTVLDRDDGGEWTVWIVVAAASVAVAVVAAALLLRRTRGA